MSCHKIPHQVKKVVHQTFYMQLTLDITYIQNQTFLLLLLLNPLTAYEILNQTKPGVLK